MQQDPDTRVSAPAVGLIVTGALGVVLWLMSLLLFGLGGVAALVDRDAADALPGFGVSVLLALVGLALSGLVIYAGLQMRKLQGWGLSMAGAIVAMIPCFGPCWILGLPIGIWAILVLIDEEVKRAFNGGYTPPPPGGPYGGGYDAPPPPGGPYPGTPPPPYSGPRSPPAP